MTITVSKKQARRFLLTKQLLLPAKALPKRAGIEAVFSRLRVIQYDPLNPCGRNPDLVLQARVKSYHPGEYHDFVYQQKKGIECYDKELCIIPTEDFSLTSLHRYSFAKRKEILEFLKKYNQEIENIFLFIKKNGSISSSDITVSTRVASGWGTDATFGRMVLEILWKLGRLVVVKRENNRKYYGVLNDHHPQLSGESVDDIPVAKEHVKRRLQSVGILPLSGAGGGWQGLPKTRKFIEELVGRGEFVEVSVIGSHKLYVIAREDLETIISSLSVRKKQMTFIAPLDTLIWDREMILDLFDFHYRWEVYTPEAKRKFGYYVLPILYGDEFVGRIEPVLRKDMTLEIKGFWKEKNIQWDTRVLNDFKDALNEFSKYLKAQNIKIPVSII